MDLTAIWNALSGNNTIVTTILGIIGIAGIWQLFRIIYEKTTPFVFIEKLVLPLTNKAGKKIYSYLAKIEDQKLREEIAKDLDDLGNKIDEAWDAGLLGNDYVLPK
jgi:hypothetical protein